MVLPIETPDGDRITMTAAAKKDFVPIRFYVEWHPSDEIEAECIKLGMKPDDGSSFWDWVEIPDHVKTQEFQDFNKAVAFAKEVTPLDCFGAARVYRQQQVVKHYGKRAFIQWDDECFWEVMSDDQPDVTKPDEWCVT